MKEKNKRGEDMQEEGNRKSDREISTYVSLSKFEEIRVIPRR